MRALFELNPKLDRMALASRFAESHRLQIPDLLIPEAAQSVHDILSKDTKWGMAWQADEDGPNGLRQEDTRALDPTKRQAMGQQIAAAMHEGKYAFLYGQYQILTAYMEKWDPGHPHDLLLEHINAEPFLNFIREVTQDDSLIKADAQATLYAPGHFLSLHDDSHKEEGWKYAYVLSMCAVDWRPDWGGYLNFYDDDGNVEVGFRPSFNTLNIFKVPQKHSVSFVPHFAPTERFAITGWFRDR